VHHQRETLLRGGHHDVFGDLLELFFGRRKGMIASRISFPQPFQTDLIGRVQHVELMAGSRSIKDAPHPIARLHRVGLKIQDDRNTCIQQFDDMRPHDRPEHGGAAYEVLYARHLVRVEGAQPSVLGHKDRVFLFRKSGGQGGLPRRNLATDHVEGWGHQIFICYAGLDPASRAKRYRLPEFPWTPGQARGDETEQTYSTSGSRSKAAELMQ